MDWLEKLKALLAGGQSGSQTPPPAGNPWDQPVGDAPPGFHRMPDGSLMRDAAMQGQGGPPAMSQGPPGSIADNPMAQAVMFARQKALYSKLSPDNMNK